MLFWGEYINFYLNHALLVESIHSAKLDKRANLKLKLKFADAMYLLYKSQLVLFDGMQNALKINDIRDFTRCIRAAHKLYEDSSFQNHMLDYNKQYFEYDKAAMLLTHINLNLGCAYTPNALFRNELVTIVLDTYTNGKMITTCLKPGAISEICKYSNSEMIPESSDEMKKYDLVLKDLMVEKIINMSDINLLRTVVAELKLSMGFIVDTYQLLRTNVAETYSLKEYFENI